MRVRILAGLLLCVVLVTSAQQANSRGKSRSLSLRECIDLALARNLDLQIEHLNADLARYSLSGAYGVYSPALALRARHDFVSQPGDFDPQKFNPDFPYEMNNDTIGPALTGRLPIGLSYDVTAFTREDNARTDFSSSIEDSSFYPPSGIRRTNNYFSEARVTLEQHLLRDAWIDADREQILIRRKDVKISQQAVRFQVMKTVLAVALSYYDLVADNEEVKVQEKALQMREQFLKETRRRVEVGDLPPLDADQAETQLQNTLTALAKAREAVATQQNQLKALLTDNFREWADVDLAPSETLIALPADVHRSESFQNALRERPDLMEARLAIEKSEVVIRFRKNQLFPNLDLVGRYGGLGVDPSVGRSINNTLDFINSEYSYGVVLSFPLYNLTERSAYRASKASREMAKLQLKKAEDEVLVQVADYVSRIESRWAQVGSTRKARTYAEAALAAEEKKLANGLSTEFVVLQLQEILTAARDAEITALADYNKALAQLAFADASILEKHHLSVEVK